MLDARQYLGLNILMPLRAIGIDKEDIPSPRPPAGPNKQIQGDGIEAPKNHDDQYKGEEHNEERNSPPLFEDCLVLHILVERQG